MKCSSSTLSRLFGDVTTPGTLDPKWALFSANSFIAAMLAVYVAFLLDLQRPYWAMLTVYLTSQPLAGAVRSKAVFRLLGTILGASAAVALVPAFVDEPVLLSVLITSWAGVCLYVSLHDRTPRGYAFMLAGYTATTVAFASVTSPDAVFETAIARVEEIVIGISCATIVHSLLFPRDVSSVVLKHIETSVRDAGTWTAHALRGPASEADQKVRHRLATDITDLEMLSTHVPFDVSAHRPALGSIRALQDNLAVILPLLTTIEDRMAALRAAKVEIRALNELMYAVSDWAQDPQGTQQAAESLRARCEASASAHAAEANADWTALLTLSVLTKLASLIVALGQARLLTANLLAPGAGQGPFRKTDRARRTLHYDSGLAALAVLAMFVAVLGCCAAWIAAAWPEGSIAAQMAAIYVAFYGGLDDAGPTLASFAMWTVVSLPIAAIYVFAIFPAIDGFPMLVVSLAPAFLVMGYFQASARHSLKALALLIGVIGAIDLQNRLSLNFASFVNVNSAEVVGILAAFVAMRVCRSVTAGSMAQKLLRRGWADLAAMASARRRTNRDRWLGVMLDRHGLVVSRLVLAGSNVETGARESITALQIGLDLIDLESALDGLRSKKCKSVDGLMDELSRTFGTLASNSLIDPSECERVLAAIDAVTREFDATAMGNMRAKGLGALVGLRRALFPAASPFIAKAGQ